MRIGIAAIFVIFLSTSCSDDDSASRGNGAGAGPGGNGASADGGAADGSSSTSTSPPATLPDGAPAPPSSDAGLSAAAKLATKLRGKATFLIGMGNDLASNHDNDGAYTLGTTLDLHYAYLVGLQGAGGWPEWNPNGTFVNALTDSADAHGTTPMFTLYAMAAWGENNLDVLANDAFMKPYFDGARLMFQRLAAFGKPAVVHLEPDFWAFAQQGSPDATRAAHITSLVPECAGISNDLAGVGQCLLKLGRTIAPNVAIGFHASSWGGDVAATVTFLKKLGADQADFIATDILDRDAGCFEAHTDPACQRGGTTGWYLDESNATSPNYHEALAWASSLHNGLGLPVMWWQLPFGVPSATPGGTAGHYRDNKVRYLFAHVDEFVAAGGVGAVFGTGASNQTYITTDGDQFKGAVTKYFASPTPLP